MNLYAKVTGARLINGRSVAVSKGQGGEWLEIEVTNEKREKVFFASIKADSIYATTYGEGAQCIEVTGEKQEGLLHCGNCKTTTHHDRTNTCRECGCAN